MKFIQNKNSIATVLLMVMLSAALISLVAATLQYQVLEPHLPLLFLLNITGVVVLVALLVIYSIRLYKRLRRKEPGTRLTIRMIRGYA